MVLTFVKEKITNNEKKVHCILFGLFSDLLFSIKKLVYILYRSKKKNITKDLHA